MKNTIVWIVITALFSFGIGSITTHAVTTILFEGRITQANKEAHLKDSLYLNCNGKISKFKSSFMYKNYIQNVDTLNQK